MAPAADCTAYATQELAAAVGETNHPQYCILTAAIGAFVWSEQCSSQAASVSCSFVGWLLVSDSCFSFVSSFSFGRWTDQLTKGYDVVAVVAVSNKSTCFANGNAKCSGCLEVQCTDGSFKDSFLARAAGATACAGAAPRN